MKLRQKKFINSHNEYLLKLKGERKISQKSRKWNLIFYTRRRNFSQQFYDVKGILLGLKFNFHCNISSLFFDNEARKVSCRTLEKAPMECKDKDSLEITKGLANCIGGASRFSFSLCINIRYEKNNWEYAHVNK